MFPLKDNIPTDHFPVVTVALILINVAVFLFFQQPAGFSGVDERKVVEYGAIPCEITHPGEHIPASSFAASDEKPPPCKDALVPDASTSQAPATWLTVLASMFMHGGFLHIAGNMLFLWIFGNNVEDSMGRGRFLLYYLLGGVAALTGQVVIDPSSTVPTVGASGAIAAVLGGYILLYPRARVLSFVFIIFFFTLIEVPAVLMLGFWFIQQIYFGAADLSDPVGGGGGVAYWAHIGGFAFGLLAIRLFASRRKQLEPRLPLFR